MYAVADFKKRDYISDGHIIPPKAKILVDQRTFSLVTILITTNNINNDCFPFRYIILRTPILSVLAPIIIAVRNVYVRT